MSLGGRASQSISNGPFNITNSKVQHKPIIGRRRRAIGRFSKIIWKHGTWAMSPSTSAVGFRILSDPCMYVQHYTRPFWPPEARYLPPCSSIHRKRSYRALWMFPISSRMSSRYCSATFTSVVPLQRMDKLAIGLLAAADKYLLEKLKKACRDHLVNPSDSKGLPFCPTTALSTQSLRCNCKWNLQQ